MENSLGLENEVGVDGWTKHDEERYLELAKIGGIVDRTDNEQAELNALCARKFVQQVDSVIV